MKVINLFGGPGAGLLDNGRLSFIACDTIRAIKSIKRMKYM